VPSNRKKGVSSLGTASTFDDDVERLLDEAPLDDDVERLLDEAPLDDDVERRLDEGSLDDDVERLLDTADRSILLDLPLDGMMFTACAAVAANGDDTVPADVPTDAFDAVPHHRTQ
jgi:hypothetical protein